jgi:uncharacterized protein YjbI with pentapeptide repeats
MYRWVSVSYLRSRYDEGVRFFKSIDISHCWVEAVAFDACDFGASNLAACRISEVTFTGCRFEETQFTRASMLANVVFDRCDLSRARMSEVDLDGAIFKNCVLNSVDLRRATIANTAFIDCDLRFARVASANLLRSRFTGSDVSGANFGGATFVGSEIDALSYANDLELDDAIIDWRTVCVSLRATNVEKLLAGTGMPEVFAIYIVSCAKALDPDRIFRLMRSTFISYGAPDAEFALKLRNDLRRNGVDTFFFASDAVPGERLHDVMRRGVNRYDRVIVICSRGSLKRPAVLNEVNEAREREARDGRAYLLPVAVDDTVFVDPSDIALMLRGRVIGDFRDAEAYPEALTGLLRALAIDAVDGA